MKLIVFRHAGIQYSMSLCSYQLQTCDVICKYIQYIVFISFNYVILSDNREVALKT